MDQSRYWMDVMRQRMSRRRLFRAGMVGGASLWLGSTLGCSGGSTLTVEQTRTVGGGSIAGDVLVKDSSPEGGESACLRHYGRGHSGSPYRIQRRR